MQLRENNYQRGDIRLIGQAVLCHGRLDHTNVKFDENLKYSKIVGWDVSLQSFYINLFLSKFKTLNHFIEISVF